MNINEVEMEIKKVGVIWRMTPEIVLWPLQANAHTCAYVLPYAGSHTNKQTHNTIYK